MTQSLTLKMHFCQQTSFLNRFKVIAFTHKSIDIEEIGRFHMDDACKSARLYSNLNLMLTN